MALDVGKGIATVLVARQIDPGATGPAVAGIAAVLGHIYPVWLGLRGGKGVATTCGVFSILAPQATAIATLVFLALVWWTRYISRLGRRLGAARAVGMHVRRAGNDGHRGGHCGGDHHSQASIQFAACSPASNVDWDNLGPGREGRGASEGMKAEERGGGPAF